MFDRFQTEVLEMIGEQVDEATDSLLENHPIFNAVDDLINGLGEDCPLCDQTLGFHSNDCAIHDLKLALDYEWEND